MNKITLHCQGCGQTSRIWPGSPLLIEPNTVPTFCPYCGKAALARLQDEDADYFEVLAESYSKELALTSPIAPDLVKYLFETWDETKHASSFADFVRRAVTEDDFLESLA